MRNLWLETGKWALDVQLDSSRFPKSGSIITVVITINEPRRREREKRTKFQDVQVQIIMITTRRWAPQEYDGNDYSQFIRGISWNLKIIRQLKKSS